jgi:hypothetical protein
MYAIIAVALYYLPVETAATPAGVTNGHGR